MMIKDVMNRNVIVAKPHTTLREAAKVMSDLNIGSLVVMENEKIVGIVTSTDALRAVAEGADPDRTTLADIMSKDVITIEEDRDVEEAVELMVKNKIKRLPVVREGKLVGIITVSDIAVVEPKIIASIASLISINVPKYTGA